MWNALVAEFSDLADAHEATRLAVRLVVAALMGAVIGYDRERNASPAGLRTHMLVALGAALFVLVGQHAGFDRADMSRVVQGLVAGIGFLGAGAILKRDETFSVRGLTTAASIWLTAAIGIAAGFGQLVTAFVAAVMGVIVLGALARADRSVRKEPDKG
ncbi:MAG: MgtC/SapB family protein [Burkholderiales bacterium]